MWCLLFTLAENAWCLLGLVSFVWLVFCFFFKNRLEFSNQEQTEILFNEQNFKHRLEYLLQEKSERFDFKNDWKQIGSFILN